MRVFISSPLGFAESTQAFRNVVKQALLDSGQEPVDPWDCAADLEAEFDTASTLAIQTERRNRFHDISMRIAKRNAETIRSCNAMLAILDGVDVDSGTASEIGYAYALGNRVINGYRGDFRRAGENEGVSVNLQVQYWIEASGGRMITKAAEIADLAFSRFHP